MIKESTKKDQKLGDVIKIDSEKIQNELKEIVRKTVEDTLNQMLDAEADKMCNAERYEHTEKRKDTRAGYYKRGLETTSGKVTLQVPRLRKMALESAIIERYKRRETSIEEAMIEMYLAGVSVRRVEDITEALWGTHVSAGTVSNINKKIYKTINEWRNRPITGVHPYVYLDGIFLKRNWGGEVRNISILVAIGVNHEGFREVIGIQEGAREDKESWKAFLRQLKIRGLKGVRLFISDKSLGLVETLGDFYPDAHWQRCVVHFYRNIFTVVPRGKRKIVGAMLKAIHAQEDKESAQLKAKQVIEKLIQMKLKTAAKLLEKGIEETLTYMNFPPEHWQKIRTNNPMERLLREIRRRTRVVGCFPDGESAIVLAAARLRYVAGTKWGHQKYLNVKYLDELEVGAA